MPIAFVRRLFVLCCPRVLFAREGAYHTLVSCCICNLCRPLAVDPGLQHVPSWMKILGVMEIKMNQFRYMAGNHSLPTALVAQLNRATLYYGFERGSLVDLYSWYISGTVKKLKVQSRFRASPIVIGLCQRARTYVCA